MARAIFGILDPDTFGLGELDLRLDAGIRLAGVSLEHGGALRELVGAGLFPSAVTLMRPPFEALRAAGAAREPISQSQLQLAGRW